MNIIEIAMINCRIAQKRSNYVEIIALSSLVFNFKPFKLGSIYTTFC